MFNCEFCKNNEFEIIDQVVFLKTKCDTLRCIEKDYNPDASEVVEFYQNIGHDNIDVINYKGFKCLI